MKKRKIILVGAGGKMGQLINDALKDKFEIIGIEKQDDINNFQADLVVDFATAESSVSSACYCLKNKVPLIVGSTGQTQKQLKEIYKVGRVAPVMKESNFSMGVLFLKNIVQELSEKSSEICIFEKHHKNKKDSPSGTAVDLKNIIQNQSGKVVDVSCQRAGEEFGTHVIDFYFEGELLSVKHQAFSRKPFVLGVVCAINFILQQKHPRVYSFQECKK